MFRGTTARTVVALLAAVLLGLPFFAPTADFAAAYTVGHVEAKARATTKLSGKALRDETASFRDCEHSGGPSGPLRTRARHRAADSGPQTPERPLLAVDPASAKRPPAPDAHHTSRPLTDPTPAALQVFRC